VWNLPGDSGVQKEVCPTSYQLKTTSIKGETWKNEQTGPFPNYSILTMERFTTGRRLRAAVTYGSTLISPLMYSYVAAKGGDGTAYDPPSVTADNPTANDYRLNSKYFGSHKQAGILYAWAQGNGW
jgi:hypothetical protein